jgi:hypothetical protein
VEGPCGFYYWNLLTKRKAAGGADIFKHDLKLSDSAVTVEYVLDSLVICGGVNSVVDQLLAFRETVGDFGTLLYAGHDWADPRLARPSMELILEMCTIQNCNLACTPTSALRVGAGS